VAFPIVNRFRTALLYGGAEHLTSQNGFRPGQSPADRAQLGSSGSLRCKCYLPANTTSETDQAASTGHTQNSGSQKGKVYTETASTREERRCHWPETTAAAWAQARYKCRSTVTETIAAATETAETKWQRHHHLLAAGTNHERTASACFWWCVDTTQFAPTTGTANQEVTSQEIDCAHARIKIRSTATKTIAATTETAATKWQTRHCHLAVGTSHERTASTATASQEFGR
jgi:hypothetical protein